MAVDLPEFDLPADHELNSRINAASSVGSEPWVFTRRRNSSLRRSITLVVRNVFHCAFGKVKTSAVRRRFLQTTHHAGHRLPHLRSKALYAVRPTSPDAAYTMR